MASQDDDHRYVPRRRRRSDGLWSQSVATTKCGARAFAVACPTAWNRVPANIRQLQTIFTFRRYLKTYLCSKILSITVKVSQWCSCHLNLRFDLITIASRTSSSFVFHRHIMQKSCHFNIGIIMYISTQQC